jgi:hypothetical protein
VCVGVRIAVAGKGGGEEEEGVPSRKRRKE